METVTPIQDHITPDSIGLVVCNFHHIIAHASDEKRENMEFLLEALESNFIHSEDTIIRMKCIESLVDAFDPFEKVPAWKSCPIIRRWISDRARDREKLVREIVWTYLTSIMDEEAFINALVELIPSSNPHHKDCGIFLTEFDESVIVPFLTVSDQKPIVLLEKWFIAAYASGNTPFVLQYMESKNFARKLVKSIACVVAHGTAGDMRTKFDKQNTVRMCLYWHSRLFPELNSGYAKAAVADLFEEILTCDMIELLIELFNPHNTLLRKLRLRDEVNGYCQKKFQVWKSLILHACNLWIDSRGMSFLIIAGSPMLGWLTKICSEELDEPGLIDWSLVVRRLVFESRHAGPGLEPLSNLSGSVNRMDHEEVDGEDIEILVKWATSRGESDIPKKFIRGLLWSNFNICWKYFIACNSFHLDLEMGKFITQFRKERIAEFITCLRMKTDDRRSILLMMDIQSTETGDYEAIDLKSIIRAINFNQDVPPGILVRLCEGLRVDDPLARKNQEKMKKILFPPSKESDIVAFCGGVRLDIIPIVYLCNIKDMQRNPLSFMRNKLSISESDRKILEYLLSLMVYLVCHLGEVVGAGTEDFLASLLSTPGSCSREHVAAIIVATLRGLGKSCPRPIGGKNLKLTVREVSWFMMSIVEKQYPRVVRMTIDKSYSITIGSALFVHDTSPRIKEKNPLILKRSRFSRGV